MIKSHRIVEMCAIADISLLPVDSEHAPAVAGLPRLHGDPFDRLLVAQAKVEPMRLATHDKMVAAYDENFMTW